jgi:transcriptional regulator with XRE-family HTH domain
MMTDTTMGSAFKKAGITQIRTFAEILKVEMKRVGMSLKEVHDQSTIPMPILKEFASGKKQPDDKSLKKLFSALPRLKHLAITWPYQSPSDEKQKLHSKALPITESDDPLLKIQKEQINKPAPKVWEDPNAIDLKSRHATFGKALQDEMKKANTNAQDLAGILDMSTSGVYNWTSDRSVPMRVVYDALLDLFPDLKDQPVPEGMAEGKKRGRASGNVEAKKPLEKVVAAPPVPPQVKAPIMQEAAKPVIKMSGAQAAFKLGILASKIENLPTVVELLEYADKSGMGFQELVQILKEM